jgi:hypothetical protein
MADWPAGNTEDFPVKPADTLVLPQGSYPVRQVKAYPGQYLTIFVEAIP